ncbi:lysis protein [Xenorhabdus bovienii]|uniref:lysis protein n=1 Tax=Xenorhabdus bovienii TaxID=40576 RepID=UPI00237CF39D|nr:lysis protein [Xenorhabdus bovienii]MDE1494530.1 lysis protein [Xenorhabdus bovienii]MDE9472672.1 lysis protein [Xenorhabdus bovienii]MDE9533701.1 lysis protein [Xenorhabdus bovienii]
MKFNSQYFTVGALVVVSGLLWFFYSEYQQKAQDYSELDTKHQTQLIAINEQQKRIQRLAELDTKHRQELDNAKTEIDTLRADVAAGRRKLRIKAICPVLETVASGSMGDAGTPQLTDAARQDYYDLLRMMAENERQTKYLQDYVNTECYKVKK